MLLSLHVKNLALIEETEVEFGKGLNILTGETGAGKSVLMGSVNLALGGKFDKDMLRKGAESALVELSFSGGDDERLLKRLEELDIPVEEDVITISRRLQAGKTTSKINGETVNTKQLKEIAEYLIDIHGQHEHQSLLHKKKHLEILDAYIGAEAKEALEEVSARYRKVAELKEQLEEEAMDEAAKLREQALLEFERDEIENARLSVGEDEALETQYRKLVNSKKITEALAESYRYTGNDDSSGAGNDLGRALRCLSSVSEYDEQLAQLLEQLTQIEDLLSEYNRDLSAYMSDMEFDGADFHQIEERLNEINHLKDKYGDSIEKILQAYEERVERLDKLADYDAYISGLQAQLSVQESYLEKACEKLSGLRRENAAVLKGILQEALEGLNFLSVQFDIAVERKAISANGYDDVEFLISTNPGEDVKPLAQVASGGELSRIMLAIKTVLASKDAIDTLIFDEIDTGISGKTAWKVSKQLDIVAREHQVICITHLPQIAAMADKHLLIEKNAEEGTTMTQIRVIEEQAQLEELARLLGSDNLTEAAISNAQELREQALAQKGV
ncbi:MAG: DNA repair protein RecN [Lachnospiraceae bacterium]|nr:DNA repair protein RecN [Lachnospiraceae bacterium]